MRQPRSLGKENRIKERRIHWMRLSRICGSLSEELAVVGVGVT
jgi:hypothetical protein